MKMKEAGQALVSLLFFVIVAIIITSAIVYLLIANSLSTSKFETSLMAQNVSEAGAENALIRLLRDPSYLGETIPVGDGTAIIEVTGESQKVITSEGRLGDFVRTTEVRVRYENNVLNLVSWKEVF